MASNLKAWNGSAWQSIDPPFPANEAYVWTGSTWRSLDSTLPDIPLSGEFVLGTTKPNASNTGLTSPTTTTINTDKIYSTAGQNIQNTLFNGFVQVKAANVTFTNCYFRGLTTYSVKNIALVRCNDAAASNTTFNRCKFFPNYWSPTGGSVLGLSVMGHRYTLNRCDLAGSVDGAAITGDDATLTGNYIHDLWMYTPEPNQSDRFTHCDCIQMHNGPSNVLIRGNTLEAILDPDLPNCHAAIQPTYSSGLLQTGNPNYSYSDWQGYSFPPWALSAIMDSPYGSGQDNLVIDQNWITGGSVAININPNYINTTATNFSITNNRWGRTQRGNPGTPNTALVIAKNSLTITMTGNKFEDDNTPYNGRLSG